MFAIFIIVFLETNAQATIIIIINVSFKRRTHIFNHKHIPNTCLNPSLISSLFLHFYYIHQIRDRIYVACACVPFASRQAALVIYMHTKTRYPFAQKNFKNYHNTSINYIVTMMALCGDI